MSKTSRKIRCAGLIFIFAAFFFFPIQAFANVLGNAGFEEPIGNGTAANWDSTNGALRTAVGPRSGSFALQLPTGTFTFQLRDGAKPGDFVSFSAFLQTDGGATGTVQIEFKRILPNGSDQLISAVNQTLGAGNPYTLTTVSGVAPEGTARIIFVFSSAGGTTTIDDANGEIQPAKLRLMASKNRIRRGNPVAVRAQFYNGSGAALTGVNLVLNIPKGFDLVNETVRLGDRDARWNSSSSVIEIGTLAAGVTMNADFVLVPTSGITLGKNYELSALISNNSNLSDRASLQFIIEGDPVFDEGTIIGKVFNDDNRNGVQDKGEKGVPWVRLATETGVVVITDEHGRYHIPAVRPGRHVVKIDGHTLPEGTEFITEEAYLVRTTPGLMNKANFAVVVPASAWDREFQKDLMVSVTQGLDTMQPNLSVRMEPDVVRTGIGVLETQPVFHLGINYPEYVKQWYLEIRDEMGHEIWSGFGVGAPPSQVMWPGQTENGLLIKPGIYSYQFKVEDNERHQDWTPLSFFRVLSKLDSPEEATRPVEIPPVGNFNVFKDGRCGIPLIAKPTIRVQGKTHPGSNVTINSLPVPTDSTGMFQTEMYTSPGEKEITVAATNAEGETVTYTKKMTVKDSTFFMVALGEEQLGVNFQGGDVESAGQDDSLKQGFYEDGRLSYYLKGKLKGKFLVTSHYDSSDPRSALFTNLDPDDYYPIYGDTSTRDYEAQNTLSRMYLLIEMDRSFVKWGSFQTAFTDTELATYNRTLSGLKVHHETLSSTAYGDPKRAFTVFASKSSHRADHNEFATTGGSLYYLRNRNVIQGSEKVRVEVRDKIQNMSIESRDLKEGADYEIDYAEGRILLSRPLNFVAASDTLISNDPLGDNPQYLVVDYEFDAGSHSFAEADRGGRAYTHMGDHIRVGGTVVEEKRQGGDYDLRAVDTRVKLGRNTKITGEYAESTLKQTMNAVSYNGGLSFFNAEPIRGMNTAPRENAFLVKAETKPVKQVDLSGYIQGVEPGFSSSNIFSQEGTKKYGVASRYNFTDNFYTRYRFDYNEISDQLMPLRDNGLSAEYNNYHTHTAQLVYDKNKWLAEAEYRLLDRSLPPSTNLIDSVLSEYSFKQGLGAKLGYRLNDRLMPYVKAQTAVRGKANHQVGGGVRYQVYKNMFTYFEQMIGNFGNTTYFGLEQDKGTSRSYMNLGMFDRGIGTPTLATTIGNSFSLSEKSRVYSERQNSTYLSEDGYSDILGYETAPNEHWNFEAKFERRQLLKSKSEEINEVAASDLTRNSNANTASGAVGYKNEKFRARTELEIRRENVSPRLWQWVTRNNAEYKINQDLSFLGKLDYGKSVFTEPHDTPAAFMEMSTGFAFRPVDFDRLNFLTRYTYVMNLANDFQFANSLYDGLETDEKAHIFAIDIAYDLHRYLGIAEKLAYKNSILNTSVTNEVILHHFLLVHRFNFHITRKWDAALEYRALWQRDAVNTLKHGPLLEVDREIYEYVRFGMGYNFTDFDDDLRKPNNYDSHGPFVRFTGKF